MTAPTPDGTPSSVMSGDGALANRLAAAELRLRLLETGETVSTADDVDLGFLRQPTTVATEPAPAAHEGESRTEWSAEALDSLTWSMARLRGEQAHAEQQAATRIARLTMEISVSRHQERSLKSVLTRVYAQAQALQDTVNALESSRSYRIGSRIAHVAGRPGPVVTTWQTPVAAGVDPSEVTLVAESGLFDPEWYAATYPDVVAAGADPLTHFMTRATTEHRCPGPMFDTGWYVHEYADLVPDGRNPLAYYLDTGWRLGHRPWESFDPDDYVRAHPELVGVDLCPLVHRAATAQPG